MTREEVVELMRTRAAERLDVAPETLGPDSDLAGLGQDSLALVEWVMDVEDALGIDLPEARTETRLGALADAALARLGGA